MSSILVFNVGATPQNVLSFIPSNADPAQYAGRNDVLVDPDLSSVGFLQMIYWKVSGSTVVAMNAGEQASVDAAIAAGALSAQRSGGIGLLSGADSEGTVLRAIGGILVDEVNTLRQWLASFKTEVAASTNLANLQSRVATLPATPDRTLAQFKAAIQNKINSGAVDS